MPKLKAVFYAAGNVKAFAQPLLDHDITLVSAWAVNAIPVAKMCLAQILLSCRGYFRAVRQYRERKALAAKAFWRPGVAGETIGLIGMGFIGMRLRGLLEGYKLEVIAHDSYLSEERAQALGVERVSLEELFRRAFVVSNHIPDLPSTRGTPTGALFETMREGATFINTGRGAQVVEADLIRVLRARPDLTALLDVTWPEPPAPDSPLWALSNVVISPHRRHDRQRGHKARRLCDRGVRGVGGRPAAALPGDPRGVRHHGVGGTRRAGAGFLCPAAVSDWSVFLRLSGLFGLFPRRGAFELAAVPGDLFSLADGDIILAVPCREGVA
jgi:hypothetical protein